MKLTRRGRVVRAIVLITGAILALAFISSRVWYTPAGYCIGSMSECVGILNCESVELVYSGVDAFILGVPTETYCYPCANEIKSKGAVIC